MNIIHQELNNQIPGSTKYWELIEWLNNPQGFLDKYYPEEQGTFYEHDCRGATSKKYLIF